GGMMGRAEVFRGLGIAFAGFGGLAGFGSGRQSPETSRSGTALLTPEEQKHLRNVRQLTFGGQNAEAYFSWDDKQLIFQNLGADVPCDQIYTMPTDTPDQKPAAPKLGRTGKGRKT